MKQILILLAVLGMSCSTVASTCADFNRTTREMFITPDGKHIVFQIFQHNDDGPGYNHWRGSLEFFDLNGKSAGALVSYINDPTDEPMPEKIKSTEHCSPQILSLYPESKAKIEKLCQPRMISLRPKRLPESHIRKFQSDIRSELKLTPLTLEKDKCGLSVKLTEADPQGEAPVKWGLLQILFKALNSETKLSLLREAIPAGNMAEVEFIGCKKVDEIWLALMTVSTTSSPCLTEAAHLPRIISLSSKHVQSAEMNVKGLRSLKEKKYADAQNFFQSAIELQPNNELAAYNLASALALLKKPFSEGEPHLKSFFNVSLENADKFLSQTFASEKKKQILKEKLKEKMLKDPDLKNWPELKKALASW